MLQKKPEKFLFLFLLVETEPVVQDKPEVEHSEKELLKTVREDNINMNEASVKRWKLSEYKNFKSRPLPEQNPVVTQEELSTPLKLPDFYLPEPELSEKSSSSSSSSEIFREDG